MADQHLVKRRGLWQRRSIALAVALIGAVVGSGAFSAWAQAGGDGWGVVDRSVQSGSP